MNLKFYDNPKLAKDEVYFGKSGQLRFKKPFVERYKLQKGERWLIGTDVDEKPCKSIYMVKPKDGSNIDAHGFKVSSSNSTFHMNLKGPLTKWGLKLPARAKYEDFDGEEVHGVRILLDQAIKTA